jgi:hypothetical protein
MVFSKVGPNQNIEWDQIKVSKSFENLFPYNPTNSNLFDPPITSSGPLNNGIIKGDYIPGSHHHISGMYFMAQGNQIINTFTGQLEPQWLKRSYR